MTTYTAKFRTDANWAEETLKADTPEQALELARAFHEGHISDLMFESYDGGNPVNEIEITSPESDALAVWRDDDLRLRLAASDLYDALEAQSDAAQAVIDAWETGDLAGAVRALDASIEPARRALVKWKGGGA
jgi:hypothetical protein